MSVSIDIIPLSDTLEMHGEPDTSAAYSLSGHVSISVASTSSMFENRRAVRLLLQSLTLTLEGQSEVVISQIGYAPIRLCSLSRELAPGEPLELSNEGHEDSDKPCIWNIVFNLPVPGWLPATSSFGSSGDDLVGIRYALFATAQFITADDNSDKTWSLSTLCSMFRPKRRVIHAPKCPITLHRYINPPSNPFSSNSLFPVSSYAIHAKAEYADVPRDSSFIPLHILSNIRVVASVPDYISVDEPSFPFAIRLRTPDMDDSERKRLRVDNFSVDVVQIEKYRPAASPEDLVRYPIPGPSLQPPNEPLLDPHYYHRLYDSGLVCAFITSHQSVNRLFSMMPSDVSGIYQLAGDGYIFEDENDIEDESTWYTIETTVPFVQKKSRSRQLRVSGNTPLFNVRHELRVAVTCTYDIPDASYQATEQLHFSIPLHFARVRPTTTSRNTPSPRPLINPNSVPAPSVEMLTCSSPYVSNLPPYSQLFDSNGDRKIDYSIPLPLYTPQLSSSTSQLPRLDATFDSRGRKPLCRNMLNLLPEEDRPLLADVSGCQD